MKIRKPKNDTAYAVASRHDWAEVFESEYDEAQGDALFMVGRGSMHSEPAFTDTKEGRTYYLLMANYRGRYFVTFSTPVDAEKRLEELFGELKKRNARACS